MSLPPREERQVIRTLLWTEARGRGAPRCLHLEEGQCPLLRVSLTETMGKGVGNTYVSRGGMSEGRAGASLPQAGNDREVSPPPSSLQKREGEGMSLPPREERQVIRTLLWTEARGRGAPRFLHLGERQCPLLRVSLTETMREGVGNTYVSRGGRSEGRAGASLPPSSLQNREGEGMSLPPGGKGRWSVQRPVCLQRVKTGGSSLLRLSLAETMREGMSLPPEGGEGK